MKKTQRKQLNITITKEQQDFINANFGKMNIGQLCKMIGLTYNKTHNNLKLMGLVTPRKDQGKLVNMEGYFDVDEFGKKYYEY